jgi:tetratricopeptide (TPR) repeat protein
MRRRLLLLVTGGGVALLAWFIVQAVEDRHFRAELRQAQVELAGRRAALAKVRLNRLAKRWPGRGDVEYWLGATELVEGNTNAALAAWSRVPVQAPEARAAALALGRLALEQFRYGMAEDGLKRAIPGGGDISDEARRLLGRLYWVLGRHDEYRRSLYREIERENDPTENLLTLWSIDFTAYPFEGMRQALEKAKQVAPDDDRVWLALADLSTRNGHFDEAGDWLTRCERARPDDLLVWEARLEWAEAAGRPDELVRAASHLPASRFTQPRLLKLNAWLAARCGDQAAERKALEALLDLEPANAVAVDRLAVLAALNGEKERHHEYRRRKAVIDAALERFRKLINLGDRTPYLADLARAAEAVDRWFEARAWWSLAARHDPSVEQAAADAQARLARAGPSFLTGGGNLADLLHRGRPPSGTVGAGAISLSMPTFTDEANTRGLTFTFDNGRSGFCQLPETMSGGVALLDFDGDGWLDIYAVQGGPFPPPTSHTQFGDRLFRNRGDGRFDDATVSSGLASQSGGYGFGVAVGDYDNDGRPDLFVTRWRSYALYHNLGHGRFEDTTAQAGFRGDRDLPTSAAWADLDNDGDLDLYVCHYLKLDAVNPTLCPHPQKAGNTYCDPRMFPALTDHVFRNDGGRFVDVTEHAGITEHDGRGLGVVAADLDADGKIDLFVANDTSANFFFHNEGGFRFTERGQEAGLAANAGGGYQAGMGVACADWNGDGRLDLAVTNFYGESTTLYQNMGSGLFTDRTSWSGLAAPTHFMLGFGLAALDANNDGRPDLVQANGHVGDYLPTTPYAMPAQLFLGDGTGKFVDVSRNAGPPWRLPRLGRGVAVGDVDNDGGIDVLIVSENAPLALLHNESAPGNHFLTLALEGTASNRDAVGARVAVTAAGQTQVAARLGGGSYLSASDHRLHFGVGPAAVVEQIDVTWPSGHRDTFPGLPADRGYRLREGDSTPHPLVGFPAVAPQK